PLYKVKKGKQERYLKDDKALTDYLLSQALDKAEFHVSADSPTLGVEAFGELAQRYTAASSIIERMAKRHDRLVLEAMMDLPKVTNTHISDEAFMQTWVENLVSNINRETGPSVEYTAGVTRREEGLGVRVERIVHGVPAVEIYEPEFFSGGEYQLIGDLGDRLDGLLGEGAYISRGDKRQNVNTFGAALNWLLADARKGQAIQRYKGLGEMNPDQLCETTLDPNTRRLLQVRIEDAVAADEVFTTLMGDHVEPRREFIEGNALSVANLDV
ncbi:MAG: DNA gyrase subunit B, partial [Pseudomonadota bacterium]